MSESTITPTERTALGVARAALEGRASAYGPADAIVFALSSARLLQDPDTAAEAERLQPQECPAGQHRTWWAEANSPCPWCRTAVLETALAAAAVLLRSAADHASANRRPDPKVLRHAAAGLDEIATARPRAQEAEALGTSRDDVIDVYTTAIAAQEKHVGDLHDAARARAVLTAPEAGEPAATRSPDAIVREWNARHPVGTQVIAYPGTRGGQGLTTATRSAAWALEGHTPVVMVEGHPACIALTHVDARPAAAGRGVGESR